MKVEIVGLNKIYPNGNQALIDINLEFGTGMFGLLGPNGAGKSSLMRIIVALMKPSSGEIYVPFDLSVFIAISIRCMAPKQCWNLLWFAPG